MFGGGPRGAAIIVPAGRGAGSVLEVEVRSSQGGGRMEPGVPRPRASPSHLPGTSGEGANSNPIGWPGDRAGARTGATVGNPRWCRIFPTTAGSERNASTTMGTVRVGLEQRGQAKAST